MPIGKIRNGLPIARTRDGLPIGRVRNDLPAIKIESELPRARPSPITSESIIVSGTNISIGNPIGLLLALTYAFNINNTLISKTFGEGPIIRIRNTD